MNEHPIHPPIRLILGTSALIFGIYFVTQIPSKTAPSTATPPPPTQQQPSPIPPSTESSALPMPERDPELLAQRYLFRYNGKWGYANGYGEIIIPAQYDHAFDFSEGLGLVNQGGEPTLIEGSSLTEIIGGQWHYINPDGTTHLHIGCDSAKPFSQGRALNRVNGTVYRENGNQYYRPGRFQFIDTNGVPTPANVFFQHAYSFQANGLALVKSDKGFHFIHTDGSGDSTLTFEDARPYSDGRAAVKLNGLWGYLDEKCALAIPAIYEDAGYFSEGLAAVKRTGLWGYINTSGEWIIPAHYQTAEEFDRGMASVVKDKKRFLIDLKGNLIPLANSQAGQL